MKRETKYKKYNSVTRGYSFKDDSRSPDKSPVSLDCFLDSPISFSKPIIKLRIIANLSPYSFALNYFDKAIEAHHYWMALAYFAILFVFSYVLYLNKGEKG